MSVELSQYNIPDYTNEFSEGAPDPWQLKYNLPGPQQPPRPLPDVKAGPHMVYSDALKGYEYSVTVDNYDEQLHAAKTALANARGIEEVYGVEAASDQYNEAKRHFIQALGVEDVTKPQDPAIYLEMGTIISKLIQTPYVDEPYNAPHGNQDRRKVWTKSINRSFEMASTMMMGKENSSFEVAAAALVTAEGLGAINENSEAKQILTKASQILKAKDDDAGELADIVEIHAKLPADKVISEELKEAAGAVILDLATDSHEILPLAA